MRFVFDKKDWMNIEDGEKNCYLLTNGLGGYSSLSIIGAAARGDQALLMSAKKAPNVRWHLVSNVFEKLIVDGEEYVLTSQRMKDGKDYEGYRYLQEFVYEDVPTWIYKINDIVVTKKILMVHEENTVAIQYNVEQNNDHRIDLYVTPLLRFTPKNTAFSKNVNIEMKNNCFVADDYRMFEYTGGRVRIESDKVFGTMYFSQDERDGRDSSGSALINHTIIFEDMDKNNDNCVIFSTKVYDYHEGVFNELYSNHIRYQRNLVEKADLTSELGKQLVLSADSYVVNRESTNGKSIIAGYPFFEDWGRDTMISLAGTTLVTGRYDDCKSILRTFAKYEKNGLLPNLFPEGDVNPMYNSVDAPLLFINSVYEYIEFSNDIDFLYEIWPVLVRIVDAYSEGTDFHIKMDEDGLISAGADMEQLTWMDVRVGDFLPTPRHGKPVEINAYWYNALCIMGFFAEKMANRNGLYANDSKTFVDLSGKYIELSAKVKKAFLDKFWFEEEKCLRDVLSGTYEENQIRCNQVWALSLPFTMLSREKEDMVLRKIKEELYTTVGLRTLSQDDPDFHEIYIGDMVSRDKAYHQGTVWTFPLGAYYRAVIHYLKKYNIEDAERINELHEGMKALEGWLTEGCIGQLAEIYDGKEPTISRGCFAQAWSVGELLRAVYEYENL